MNKPEIAEFTISPGDRRWPGSHALECHLTLVNEGEHAGQWKASTRGLPEYDTYAEYKTEAAIRHFAQRLSVHHPLLLQVAGYLQLIADGITPTPSQGEAAELLDKIGAVLAKES